MNNNPQSCSAGCADGLLCKNDRPEELPRQDNSAKREFLLNISHDIRTPMNAIIGFTEIALRQNPDETVRRCLENISESSARLMSIIDDMLAISRVECGLETLTLVPVKLCGVTDCVLSAVRELMAGRDLKLEVERGKRLVKQKNARLYGKRPCNGDPLLLTAGKRGNIPALKTLEVNKREHFLNLFADILFFHALVAQTESNVFINIEMRKKLVSLEYCVNLPFMRREIVDVLTFKHDAAAVSLKETCDNPQHCCFSAA